MEIDSGAEWALGANCALMIKLFPISMLLLSFGASIVYFYNGDLRRGFYWLFAAGITAAVTW